MTSSSLKNLQTTLPNTKWPIELALPRARWFTLARVLLSIAGGSVTQSDQSLLAGEQDAQEACLPDEELIFAEETKDKADKTLEKDGHDELTFPQPAIALVSANEAQPTNSCEDGAENCRQAINKLREDKLADIGLDIKVGGRAGNDYPCECRLEGEQFEQRRFATTMFTWKAADYCHKPLYFEDWNLERYGHSHGWLADPFVSAAHFFVTLPVLPYKMGVELPWECIYPLGYYRPGNCAPWTCPAVPISARGMAIEAATVTGIVFILP